MKLWNSPSVLPSNRRCLCDLASVGCTTLPKSSFASCDCCSSSNTVDVAPGCMRITGVAAKRSRGSARLPPRRGDCPGPAAHSAGRTLAVTLSHGCHLRFGFLIAGCNPPLPEAHNNDIPGARSAHSSRTVASSNSPRSKCPSRAFIFALAQNKIIASLPIGELWQAVHSSLDFRGFTQLGH